MAMAVAPPRQDGSLVAGSTSAGVEVEVVNVEVRVTDRDGRPVTGLTARDFRLSEDGDAVSITHFAEIAAAPAGTTSVASREGAHPSAGEGEDGDELAATHVLIYVDNQHLLPANRTRVLRQVADFVSEGLLPTDLVSLVTDEQGVRVRLPFTSDRAALRASLAAVETLAAGGPAVSRALHDALDEMLQAQQVAMMEDGKVGKRAPILGEAATEQPVGDGGATCGSSVLQPVHAYAQLVRDDGLRTLAHLRYVVNSLAGLGGRKALLYVGDGIPLEPGAELYEAFVGLCGGGAGRQGMMLAEDQGAMDNLGEGMYSSTQEAALAGISANLSDELRRVAAHANTQGVTLYTLQASGLGAAGSAGMGPGEQLLTLPSVAAIGMQNPKQSLVFLANETGGRALLDGNDYSADLRQMRADLGTYYSLGFSPAYHGDGKEHRLKVEVTRGGKKASGLRLDYRRSYRAKRPLEQVVDRTLAAAMHGFTDNPLEVLVEVGAAAAADDGTISLPVQLKIPLFKLALVPGSETYTGRLRLLVVIQPTGGEPSQVRQVEVPLALPKIQLLTALGQYYRYDLTLRVEPGEQRVAVAVRDEVSTVASYLVRALDVAPPPAVESPPSSR